ncbi:hypothetical protein [Streptomyces sp. Iso 434]|uniref:hypothetical protein n=1 Tax=Streptomyces sp. Iso 434 TaxID=3062272 RepID=UPI00397F645D
MDSTARAAAYRAIAATYRLLGATTAASLYQQAAATEDAHDSPIARRLATQARAAAEHI